MEYRVCNLRDVPAARGWPVRVAGRSLAVFVTAEGVFAVDNLCIHNAYPLDDGVVEDGCVVCPWHGWIFELSTGAQVLHSFTEDGLPLLHRPGLRTYPARILDGEVIVEV